MGKEHAHLLIMLWEVVSNLTFPLYARTWETTGKLHTLKNTFFAYLIMENANISLGFFLDKFMRFNVLSGFNEIDSRSEAAYRDYSSFLFSGS